MVTCYNVQHRPLHSFECPLCDNNPEGGKNLRKHTCKVKHKGCVNKFT